MHNDYRIVIEKLNLTSQLLHKNNRVMMRLVNWWSIPTTKAFEEWRKNDLIGARFFKEGNVNG